MGETEIVAILDRSAGNDVIGDMWKETAVFPISASIADVLKWAVTKSRAQTLDDFRSNLTITLAQRP